LSLRLKSTEVAPYYLLSLKNTLQSSLKLLPLIMILLLLLVFVNSSPDVRAENNFAEYLEAEIAASFYQDFLADFYENNDFESIWVESNQLSPQGEEVYSLISAAQEVGLNPEDYNYEAINDLWMGLRYQSNEEFPADKAAEMELLITEGLVRYTTDLINGRLNPDTFARRISISDLEGEVLLVLSTAQAGNGLTEVFSDLQPQHPQYQKLLDINQRIVQGDMRVTEEEQQIINANLEKWRWNSGEGPAENSDKHIYVNLPSFTLQVYEGEEVVMDMKTIIGRPAHQTPEMNKHLTHLTLSPRWYMPRSIALREHLPKIQEDQRHLERGGYRVYEEDEDGRFIEVDPDEINWEEKHAGNFDYYLWQDAGPDNALGRVVFRFPNRQSIYLHDTPDQHIFNREVRAESSGCIRIDQPLELAQYLLADNTDWDLQRINEKIQDGNETTVYLNNPLPIHLVYFTAGVNEEQELEFYNDIYNRVTDLKNILANLDE